MMHPETTTTIIIAMVIVMVANTTLGVPMLIGPWLKYTGRK